MNVLERLVVPLLLLFFLAPPLAAQEKAASDSARVAAADSAETTDSAPTITPRGALIRSILVPGWGQAYTGSYLRGGVYFAAQMGSWYMLLKTMARLGEARSIERQRVANVRRELLIRAQSDTALQRRYADPAQLEADIAADKRVEHIRKLVDARKEQREDWIAQTIFWTFASALDAFVGAHLADFPAGIAAQPREGGGVELRLSVPAGGKP
ncbi:MAG: DUF5683 domain-containing protein [bacterium]|nr:MAG: hypothetical protein DIU52_14185 [bacterium]